MPHIVLAALVIAAAVVDWRTHRLPNVLTLGGLLVGLAVGSLPGGIGALDASLGALTGLAALLPLYVLGVTGAGDVKLLAMVGAFLGLPDVLSALLVTLVAGGLVALGFAAWHQKVRRLAVNVRDLLQLSAMAAAHGYRPDLANAQSIGKLPYGICICIGTLAWLAWVHWRA
jgi:prepilin peptidase CpaA